MTVSFGGMDLFTDISLSVGNRDRIGLVGKNGVGKTTLLRIIMGEQPIDSGSMIKPKNLTIGYLPQELKVHDTVSLFSETKKAFDVIIKLHKDIDEISGQIATRTDYESQDYLNLLNELEEKNHLVALMGGQNIDELIERTLIGLGFEAKDFDRPTREFSGGWRMRIELAKVLLSKPQLLLLDEPTNHLDIESIQWLENYLTDYPGSVILISHDKAFLDAVATRTVELSLGKSYDYNLPFSKYVEQRKMEMEQQKAAFDNQQKKIADTEKFIERFRYKATKANQVQSRIKQLEKLDVLEIDEIDRASIHFRFPPAPRSGTIVLEAIEASKSYGSLNVLKNVDFIIERGEKVAFVGKNGEGKTTFSKMLIGELEYEGIIKTGHNVHIGYYAQNQDDLLDGTLTVFETLDRIAVGDIRTRLRSILGAFLFGEDDIDKKVRVLSGGEKSRLALAKLLLEPYNLLVLDEPTNHLDMRSKDILKQALAAYDGTLILVSHDRDFLDNLVEKIYEFRSHKIKENVGGIYDFLQRKNLSNLAELERNTKLQKAQNKDNSDNKIKFQKKKEQEKLIRKKETEIQRIEKEIEDHEEKLDEMNQFLANPSSEKINITIEEAWIKHASITKELEAKMSDWEVSNSDLEKLKTELENI